MRLIYLSLAMLMACAVDRGTNQSTDTGDLRTTPTSADSAPDTTTTSTTTETPEPTRILPLGDSLTLGYGSAQEGAGSECGYRLELWRLLTEAGVDLDFVGSQSNGSSDLPDWDHEGYNGYAIAQVGEVANAAIEAHDPQVVLLLAGTNDQIWFVPPSQSPVEAAADFEELLQQIDAVSPGIQIVAGQVIPLVYNASGVRQFNDLLPGIVDRQRGNGVNVRLVDHYAIGDQALAGDGIHPTQAGYDAMAEIWLPAVVDAIAEL